MYYLLGSLGMVVLLLLEWVVNWWLEVPRLSGWRGVVGNLPVMLQGGFLVWVYMREQAE
jgi:hypothetical protein